MASIPDCLPSLELGELCNATTGFQEPGFGLRFRAEV